MRTRYPAPLPPPSLSSGLRHHPQQGGGAGISWPPDRGAAGGVLSPRALQAGGLGGRPEQPTYMCRDFCAFTTSSLEL